MSKNGQLYSGMFIVCCKLGFYNVLRPGCTLLTLALADRQ